MPVRSISDAVVFQNMYRIAKPKGGFLATQQ